MSKQIIIIKPKALLAKDKEKLTKAGFIVIEHENYANVIFRPVPEDLPYIHTNCSSCGDRIYMTEERMKALRANKYRFYCSHGHENRFI